jgi:TRAP-type uncharacterized transport system substrate-binding protein
MILNQSLKLLRPSSYSEGKNLIDVVIALNLQPDEVQEIYRQFLKLKDMRELVEVYDEMQNYLPSLLELFRLIVHRELDKNDIITVTNAINTGQLQYMKKRIQNMTDAVNWLDNQIEKKEYYLKSLNNRIWSFSHRERSPLRKYLIIFGKF